MRSTSLFILITLISLFTACAETDEVSTSEDVSALESPCTADKSEFKDYYAATACTKSNPALFQLAIGAIVKAGGKCTAVDDVRACTSIEPIDDGQTRSLVLWPISCRKWDCRPDPIAGLGYCKAECCLGTICTSTDKFPQLN